MVINTGKKLRVFSFCMACLMICLLVMTGCSAKKKATPESFTAAAEAQGFSVVDNMENASQRYNIESFLAASNGVGVFAYYTLFGSTSDSQAYFTRTKAQFAEAVIHEDKVTAAYSVLKAEQEGGMFYLVRLEETVILCSCTKGYEKFSEKLLKELKYY